MRNEHTVDARSISALTPAYVGVALVRIEYKGFYLADVSLGDHWVALDGESYFERDGNCLAFEDEKRAMAALDAAHAEDDAYLTDHGGVRVPGPLWFPRHMVRNVWAAARPLGAS